MSQGVPVATLHLATRMGWTVFLSEGKEEDNGPGSGCRQIINERLCGNCIIDNLILVLKW